MSQSVRVNTLAAYKGRRVSKQCSMYIAVEMTARSTQLCVHVAICLRHVVYVLPVQLD